MPTMKEQTPGSPNLMVSREPVGPRKAGERGSLGDQAVMDAVMIVAAAWFVLFFLAYSLRSHNI